MAGTVPPMGGLRSVIQFAIASFAVASLSACSPREESIAISSATRATDTGRSSSVQPDSHEQDISVPFRLIDVAKERGVDFVHHNSSRAPLTIVETMGSGCAFIDYDGDGRQDIFLVNAGDDFNQPRQTPGSRLYRNTGDGHFIDVTAKSGIVIDGYATGCCVGDFDNDGRDDLFVTGYGRNWLFRNRGDGRFEDVTAKAGILSRPGAWGIGCAFVDVNRDGLLDLYVGNYVRYDPSIPYCETAGIRHGCTPNQYQTQRNELYINQGNGRFVERAVELGADDPAGAALGVLVCDFDGDGWPDIFIANDGTPNALLHNVHGRFQNVAQSGGVAYGEDGVMRAGMGADAGDIDGDGRLDLIITNFQNEPTSVYRNAGKMSFNEVSTPCGIGAASLGRLKFGVCFVDLDGDGLPDLYQGNGHVHDNVERFSDISTFEQIDQVYLNVGGGKFKEITPSTGAIPDVKSVSRAVAIGDFNNDGAPDILINSLGRPARLLENRRLKNSHWLGLKLIGAKSNRSAIGARVEVRQGGKVQVREVRSGGSYIGQSDLRVLFGLGAATDTDGISVKIKWPSGIQQTLERVTLDRYSTVIETN